MVPALESAERQVLAVGFTRIQASRNSFDFFLIGGAGVGAGVGGEAGLGGSVGGTLQTTKAELTSLTAFQGGVGIGGSIGGGVSGKSFTLGENFFERTIDPFTRIVNHEYPPAGSKCSGTFF